MEVRALRGLALARLALGDLELALDDAESALREIETLQVAVLRGNVLTTLAAVLHAAGRSEEAEATAVRAVETQQQTGANLYLTTAQTLLTTIRS